MLGCVKASDDGEFSLLLLHSAIFLTTKFQVAKFLLLRMLPQQPASASCLEHSDDAWSRIEVAVDTIYGV